MNSKKIMNYAQKQSKTQLIKISKQTTINHKQSHCFSLAAGMRQGGVWSPLLFAISGLRALLWTCENYLNDVDM